MNSTTISTNLTSRALHGLSRRGNPLTPVVSGIVAAVCLAIVVFILNIIAVGFCVFYMFQGSRYYRRQVQLLDEESKKLVEDEETATETVEDGLITPAVADAARSGSRAMKAEEEKHDDTRKSAWKTNSGLFLLDRMRGVRQTSKSHLMADLEGDCTVTVKSPTLALYKQALTQTLVTETGAGPGGAASSSVAPGMQVSPAKPDDKGDGLFVSSDRSRMSFWKRDSVSRFEPMDLDSTRGSFRGQAV